MRPYLKSHPWLRFELDARKFTHKLWMTLGEAKSKCDHIAGVPLKPGIQEKLHLLYLAKGVHGTTAIEGNTLSLEEVEARISSNLELPASRGYLGREIDNIVAACNMIVDRLMAGRDQDLSLDEIKEFNGLVLKDLDVGDEVVPGGIRNHAVGVLRYRAAPAEDCEFLLGETCKWLNDAIFKPVEDHVAFGILRAILAHLYLAWIHPFGDGNGRTARLLEFKILLAHGVPSAAAHLLSNHYNATREEYYRQLDYASKSGGDITGFIQYALQGFIDGLREQINVIKNQQLGITWRDFVYDNFRNRSGPANERRRKLVLDMSSKPEVIPFKSIRHVSPRIAELYAGKTDRAVRRDLNDLIRIGLVRKMPGGYRAKSDTMRAFLPVRIEGKS